MPPTIVLRDYPPDISSWATVSNQTNQILPGNSTLDASAVGFIVPVVVTISILTIVLAACSYQIIVLLRKPQSERPATTPTIRINTEAMKANRKKKIDQELVSESFSIWRAKQLQKTRNHAAFPTQVICTICLGEFVEDDIVRDLDCTHVFHVICLDEWYSRGHNQCPLCKSALCDSNDADENI